MRRVRGAGFLTELLFHRWKTTAFLVSFALVLVIERILRWRKFSPGRGAGVLRNLPLAAADAALLGIVCSGCSCAAARWAAETHLGLFHLVQVPQALAVAGTILALDLLSWVWHRANHLSRFLWRFHAVHHSDPVFDTTTSFRFHPGELLLALPIRLSAVILLGAPVAGVLAFEIVFALFNLFVHGNIRLPLRFETTLERVFVHPAMHRAHHSQITGESNSNYGTIFSVWDRIFRTHFVSNSGRDVRIGLAEISPVDVAGIFSQLRLPLRPSRKRQSE